eukprot:Hpha_TRINITY_DN32626_c0_g1::TRINITY_DN32626_c0_g1_i1::g.30370::m.30370
MDRQGMRGRGGLADLRCPCGNPRCPSNSLPGPEAGIPSPNPTSEPPPEGVFCCACTAPVCGPAAEEQPFDFEPEAEMESEGGAAKDGIVSACLMWITDKATAVFAPSLLSCRPPLDAAQFEQGRASRGEEAPEGERDSARQTRVT